MDSYKTLKFVLKPIFKILYRPTIIHKEKIPTEKAFIFAGNHKNALDPALVALSTKRTVRFLAKKELLEGKTKLFFKAIKAIPVDRKHTSVSAVDTAIKILKDNGVISLFPEGTRNKTNKILLPFKFGAVSMAQKTKSPIVPFAITGDYKLFRKGIKIEFGEPIDIRKMELEEANEYLMQKVEELIKKNINGVKQ